MPINNNLPLLHRKEFQMMTPAPVAAAAAMYMIAPGSGNRDLALYLTSSTVQYLYQPSGALAGTFGAGACGTFSPWSVTYTANGGTTSTVTVAATTHNINNYALGDTIEFLNGTNLGLRRYITNIRNNAGAGTITITLDSTVSVAVVNTDTFRIGSGRFYCMNAGTTAAGSWKTFDVATYAWQANLSTTNLPGTWGTDGKCVSTAKLAPIAQNGTASAGTTTTLTDSAKSWISNAYKGLYVFIISGTGKGQYVKILSNTSTVLTFETAITSGDNTSVYQITKGKPAFASGVATSATGTTLVNSGKAWTVDQWINYQVRIVEGTGRGQRRTITDSDATSLTVAAWSVNPDSTSVYAIEGNEDFIYLAGNAALAMYRYSISANTWTLLVPTTPRSASPSTGMCLDWVSETGNANWANENDIQDGRYIYSMRGGAVANIDRFDIAGGTAGAGAWEAVTYIGTETFTTGSSAFQSGQYLYIKKDATNRFFQFDIVGNHMEPFTTNMYTDGAAVMGQKLWVKNYDASENIKWLYVLGNSLTVLHRIMIF
jgi:hypothetical protein